MGKRIFTAMILAGVVIAVLLLAAPTVARVMFGLFIAAGAWEWSGFLGAQQRSARAGFVLAVAVLAPTLRELLGGRAEFALLMQLSALCWALSFFWVLFAPARVSGWSAALAGLVALVPTWVALTRMVEHWPRGPQWALFVLVLAFAADTGAFFAGRAFGRVKLAPRVSPGKTWEGVIGGMALAAAMGVLGAHWFGLPVQSFLPLCLLSAAFSVIGDLTESMFKRAAGLKDSGRLFPGHGGVLDRIDSVLGATPILCVGLLWLGVGA
ncbi:MAG TPA: phosphatidate cytidylyltransferase [Steroidobacteraceae bacterium]|nr:phosphatidate cytidylyltransferase [Steroidobacteraceae bacterium]